MLYFIVLFVILFGIYKFDYRNSQQGRLLLWVLLCVTLICIAGFRYRVGGDTIQYMNYFKKAHILSDLKPIDFVSTRFAPGFVLFISTCKTISQDFMLVQFAVSIIINTVVFRFLWLHTRHIYFALLLYAVLFYFVLNTEVIRETLAVSIFLLSWPFFKEGKWLQYYFMALIACFFHISAFCLLLLPLVNMPGLRYFFTFGKRLWFITLALFMLGLTLNYLFIDFIKVIAFTEQMVDQANLYDRTDLAGAKSLNIFGILTRAIRYVIYPLCAIYFINKNFNDRKKLGIGLIKMERLTICSVYICILAFGVFILQRYNNYLFIFPIILMSDWIFSILNVGGRKIRLQFISWCIIFVPMFFLSFYSYYFHPENREGTLKTYMTYYPYKTWFSKETDEKREKLIRYLNRPK